MKLIPQITTAFTRMQEPALAALRKAGDQTSVAKPSTSAETSRTAPDMRMQNIKSRLGALLSDGMRVHGGIRILSGSELTQPVVPPRRTSSPEVAQGYQELKAKADTSFLAMHALDSFSLRDFAASSGSGDANIALVDAVYAQHALYQAAKELQSAMGKGDAGLVRIMADSQSRASELMNLAARMIPTKTDAGFTMNLPQGAERLDGDASFVQSAQTLGSKMHGTDTLLEQLSAKAEPLLNKVDFLADSQKRMSPDEFSAQLMEVKQDLAVVQQSLAEVLNPTASETPTLRGDAATFTALKLQLAGAQERLDTLGGKPNFEEVAYNYAIALTDSPGLWDIAESLPLSESIKDLLGRLDSGTAEIRDALLPYAGTKFDIVEVANEITTLQDDYKVQAALCRTVCALAFANAEEGISETSSVYADALARRLPFLEQDEVDSLAEEMVGLVNAAIDDPKICSSLEELKSALSGSIFNLGPQQIRAEVRELRNLALRGKEADTHRGAFIAKAFDNTFSVSTLTEICARGIDPSCVDFIAHDGALTTTPVQLGSGVCNTVLLCTYQDAKGVEIQRVFKGEVPARRGLVKLTLGKLGYDPLVRVAQINVAAKQVASALQCGNVLSQASVGVHDGQFGLFMECAPGKTAAEFDTLQEEEDTPPVVTTQNGVALTPTGLYAHLHKEGLMDTARANMQRGLCNLEWADMLCGQGDRHQSNYLVNINPDTAEVHVTGIDNDASFGRLMVGAAQVDVSGTTFSRLHDLASTVFVNGEERLIVDMSELDDSDKMRVRNVFGFNQMSVPELIDKTTFDALMAIDETTYAEMLSTNLDGEAVRSALLRLRDAKSFAMTLEDNGRVVTDWSSDSVPLQQGNPSGERVSITEMLNRTRNTALRSGNSASLGFYMRDFANLLA